MEEVKTLKDIFERTGSTTGNFGVLMKDFNIEESEAAEAQHICSHLHEDLKEEAIKWIKADDCFYLKDNPEPILMDNSREVFKRFFNITDEDLNERK